MIDLTKSKQYFKEYTSNYDINNSRIKIKIVHTYHVAENTRMIARSLILSEDEVNLAELIGLLHDIGRFEQVKLYGTFSDKLSIDHANKGLEVLFADKHIRNFIDEDVYDAIIYKAINNHNKIEIEKGLSKKEILNCKIIREADKIDIFRAFCDDKLEDLVHFDTDDVSKEILSSGFVEKFKQEKLLLYSDCKTNMDFMVAIFAFIYELNFQKSLKIIKENEYIYKILKKINAQDEDTKAKMEEIANYANDYIDKKIKEKGI